MMYCILLLTAVLHSDGMAQQKEFIKGADVSWLQEIEAGGGIFRERGSSKDALMLLRKNGFNYLRLRIWHTPENGINDLPHTLAMALRAKENGFKLLIDFHFSDWWADPGKQTIPAVWKGLPFAQIKDSVRLYVSSVFAALKAQGTLPSMVQFGNEIICGMMWNEGNVCGSYNTTAQWTKLGELLISAHKGMKDAIAPTDTVTVMIHIDTGGNHTTSTWFFDNLIKYFGSFDVIGLSFYPWWHGTIAAMKDNVDKLAVRYNKEIILAEIAYPFTLAYNDAGTNIVGSAGQLLPGYPATVEGQKQYLTDILAKVRTIPMQKGRGVFYWEPDGISAPGWTSVWENLALFGFDGEVLASMKAFQDSTAAGVHSVFRGTSQLTLECFPNPFNPTATVQFTVERSGEVTVELFSLLGQSVRMVYSGNAEPGRVNRISTDGSSLSGGVYFLRLRSDHGIQMKKVLLVK